MTSSDDATAKAAAEDSAQDKSRPSDKPAGRGAASLGAALRSAARRVAEESERDPAAAKPDESGKEPLRLKSPGPRLGAPESGNGAGPAGGQTLGRIELGRVEGKSAASQAAVTAARGGFSDATPAAGRAPQGPAPLKPQTAAAAGGPSSSPVDDESGGDATLTPEELLEKPANDWQVAPSAVDFEDPLVACLSTLAGLLQRPISAEALKAGLPHAEQRFTPELAVRAAERAGMTARIMRRPKLKQILPVTLPCILLLKGGNACVLTGYPDKTSAQILLPEGGLASKTVDLAALEQQYSGYAIFARPEFKFDSRASDIRLKDSKAWFWGTLARFWPIYGHVLIASVLINCFAIASPLFIMNVYDRVVPNAGIETLSVLAIGVVTVFVFEFVMRNLRTYFVDIAGKNADVIIASRLLEQLMAMRLSSKPPSTGAMANNLREFESLREFFTSGTLVAFVDLPFIFLFIGVIWLVAGSVAFIPLVTVPLVIIFGAILQSPLRSVIEKSHKESSQKHALLVETIDGLETIKATAAEGRVQRAWERFVGLTAESSGRARFISGLATTFAQTAIQLSTVAVVVFGVFKIIEGEITMGALVASTILTGRALAPLGAIAGMLTRLQQSRVALKSLDTIMKSPVERSAEQRYLHRPHLSGQIEFQKVSFSYPNQETKALDGISFKVSPGEKVAVLGRIGSGKSTIARLMIGLYEPAEGAVLMDGTDIRQIDPADLRRNVGYVSQDNYLFFGSVRENIAFGAPHVDDQTVLRAANTAGVTDFLRTHPHGFDVQVGERGMGLSGGQRQAIVIARALLLDPPVILLDEPTSCMDNSSESAFKNRLNQILPGKTLVLITHRSSLLSLVDRLVIVDGGKIVADGPKDEVLNALRKGQIRSNNA